MGIGQKEQTDQRTKCSPSYNYLNRKLFWEKKFLSDLIKKNILRFFERTLMQICFTENRMIVNEINDPPEIKSLFMSSQKYLIIIIRRKSIFVDFIGKGEPLI